MSKHQISRHPVIDSRKLKQLLVAQDTPCVSILVNLFTAGNMLKQNVANLKRSVDRVIASIEIWHADDEIKETLNHQVELLSASFENTGTSTAIGIFASQNIAELIEFPFPVIECSIVGKSFEIRDVLYFEQYLEPYYALNINKDSMRLFKGHGDSLVEITSEKFPTHNNAQYEYEHASIGSSHGYSLKGFEKDKGSIANIRQEAFVKSSARNLAGVINDAHAQLVVAGPARLVNEIELVYPYGDNLSRIDESFNARNFSKFSVAVWEKILQSKKDLISRAIQRVSELPLNSKAEGLRDVWEAAVEGRGLLLLVERDLQRIVYRLSGTNLIRLHPPKERYEVIADGVDDVIEMVRNKHGRVIFTEPGQLGRYDGIVLTLRY